ncbi:MAG: carboxylesterase family protein [Bacilli bacterium]|nr:carboxylesterase family protein [Bacilli bacterium]
MERKRHIAFYIVFPIAALIIGAVLLFAFDLLNGPAYLFVLEMIFFALFVIACFLLVHHKMRFRLIPWGAFLVVSAVTITLSKPTTEHWSAVTYANPEKTEALRLDDGLVQGVYTEDRQVEVYAGIPYAKPPVGEYRWKEPQDPDKWEGIRDCTYFAAKSMQPAANPIMNTLVDIYAEKGWHPDYKMYSNQDRSEDSLYLNIWRPVTEKTNLPILFFIHGGSLTSGSTAFADYNGESLAHHGVIVINVAYRLGVFGYFAHPDLANESPNGTTGNYGLLDQIKALEWVKRNAAYFGGDANNVTIAGESAGSSSVSALCSSPLASGLFKRAIGESSSIIGKQPPHTFRSMEDAQEVGAKIMKEFHCSSIEELRKVPAEQLVQTAYSNGSMTLDGYALTKMPNQVYADGENNEEALLNGYNVKEADAFVVPTYLTDITNKGNIRKHLADVKIFDEDIIDKIMDLYAEKIEKDAFSAFNEIISVYWFIHPHHIWSEAAVSANIPVYRYQFTKENGYYGTYHSGEMIYCYGNVEKARRSFAYNQSDYDLSKTMVSYWVNFIKNGDPNGAGLPTWSTYNETKGSVMELGEHVGAIDDRYVELYKNIDVAVDKDLAKAN